MSGNQVGERFWSKVSISEDDAACWPWTAGVTGKDERHPDGYGSFRLGGKMRKAHRVAFEDAHGPLLENEVVDHIDCTTTLCCNPHHLRRATVKQNAENRKGGQRTRRSSRFRGVSQRKDNGRWRAIVGHNGKLVSAGTFDTEEEAAEAARLKRLELFTHTREETAA